MAAPLLSLDSISKRFPGVQALSDVNLTVKKGEVVGLIGENGAGKSTLIKILGGIYKPDEGEICIEGTAEEIESVRDAMRLGVSIIHQELNLCENLSIAENIFLGRQPTRFGSMYWRTLKMSGSPPEGRRIYPSQKRAKPIRLFHAVRTFLLARGISQITDRRTLYQKSEALLNRVGLQVSPKTILKTLSVGKQQLVEIAKALSLNAKLIVFDEPTSSLSQVESEQLFNVVRNLQREGVGVIYVSHRLGEMVELANRVVVLRDGFRVGDLEKDEISYDAMVSMMVGRNIEHYYHHERKEISDEPALEVEDFEYPGCAQPVNFSVQRGEIVAFAGLVGAGRTDLARALFGIDPHSKGTVKVNGETMNITKPLDAVQAGLFLVPEERKTQGLVLEMTIPHNISMASLRSLAPAGLLNRKAERTIAQTQVHNLSIRTPWLDQKVLHLSGGNQQKVVLGKWLSMNPKVLILDEPTRGVDVGAKSEIYSLISDLSSKGIGILMISSEMEEVIAMSDRVIVMHEGKITGELTGSHITEEKIMTLCVGRLAA